MQEKLPLNIINKKNINDNLIQSYLKAIDNKKKEEIKILYNEKYNDNAEKDVVFEMYIKNELNLERLQFIVENCTSYLNISSSLIKELIKDNNKELLEILFKNYLKFFDNKFILNLIKKYENKTPITDFELSSLINNDKYKISTELGNDFEQYDSSNYLFNTCKSGNETAVKFLLEHGADMTIRDKDNRIALALACESGNLNLVKYLIHLGADINNENNFGLSHMFNACYGGNLNIVKYLVEHGLDINKESIKGTTPLFNACLKGHTIVVKYLVELGANINKENIDGWTPLLIACQNGHEDIVEYLLEHGANINKVNNDGVTPLFSACRDGNLNGEKYFVKHGENINKKDNNDITSLFIACQNGKINVVKYLVEHGENINKEDNNGWTPLFFACQYGHENLVKYLVEFGASINKEDNDGVTPLSIACEKGDEGIIRYLIKRGAIINKKFFNKFNPKIIRLLHIFEKDKRKMVYHFNCEAIHEYKILFENKVNQLQLLNEMKIMNSFTFIEIKRNNIFNDAFNSIMSKSPQELKNKLIIIFKGEEGVDAGGLLREFFFLISKEIGNPDNSLFKYSHGNSYELEINPNSGVTVPNHLKYFRFIGRFIGLAIFNKQYLSLSFTLPLYKSLLNIPIENSDLEYVDIDFYKNLQYIKYCNDVESLYLNFTTDIEDCFSNHKTVELKPNGADIDVTDSNKNEYINLMIKNKLNNTNINEQLNALKQGFYEIIPQSINTILDDVDLKILLSGLNIIDVDDWENNTDYEGYEKNDKTIINFWKCVRNFSNEDRIKLLRFVTGNSQVPVTGFKDLQGGDNVQHFNIKKTGTENDLPKSHTCFNRIDLPPYTSFDILKRKLLYAINEAINNFGFAYSKRLKAPQELVKNTRDAIKKLKTSDYKVNKEISRNLVAMKNIIYGDGGSDPVPELVAQLVQEIYKNDLLLLLVQNIEKFEYEAKKDVPHIFNNIFISKRISKKIYRLL